MTRFWVAYAWVAVGLARVLGVWPEKRLRRGRHLLSVATSPFLACLTDKFRSMT